MENIGSAVPAQTPGLKAAIEAQEEPSQEQGRARPSSPRRRRLRHTTEDGLKVLEESLSSAVTLGDSGNLQASTRWRKEHELQRLREAEDQ